MKICPKCRRTYDDGEQNYCLNDGAVLEKSDDDPPPTLMFDQPRVTDPNWQTSQPSGWQPSEPIVPWQNQANLQEQSYAPSPMMVRTQDQTLPIVSLVLGILSIVLFCCYGGLPLGAAALVTGYLGMNNVKNNSEKYSGYGMAVAGLILGAIAIFGSIILIILAIIGNIL